MTFDYLVAPRTNGANPFKIFESLSSFDAESLAWALRQMDYQKFLGTAYWFAVSSVAKSRAGMRCQVCDCGTGIEVHHRSYTNHGREHLFMIDLTVLCTHCHGLFHGHKVRRPDPPTPAPVPVQSLPVGIYIKPPPTEKRVKIKKNHVKEHTIADVTLPEGLSDPVVLTSDLVWMCRANGSFTNATLRAFGVTKATMTKGWPARLVGQSLSLDKYRAAFEGRFIYNSGRLT